MEVAPFFVDFHHFLSIFTIFCRFSQFTHFCRDLHFVAIYALFPQFFFGQNGHLRNKSPFLDVCGSWHLGRTAFIGSWHHDKAVKAEGHESGKARRGSRTPPLPASWGAPGARQCANALCENTYFSSSRNWLRWGLIIPYSSFWLRLSSPPCQCRCYTFKYTLSPHSDPLEL